MATLVTPGFVRKAASSPRARLGVGNLFLVTATSPLGSLIRVAATTLSRCTSRPAALSACCFTPHLLSRPPTARTCVGRWERTKVEAESGVRARSDTQWSPRPRVRLLARTWLQVMFGDHTPAATIRISCLGGDPPVMGTSNGPRRTGQLEGPPSRTIACPIARLNSTNMYHPDDAALPGHPSVQLKPW